MAKHCECPLLRRCCLVPAYRRGFDRAQCRAPSSVTAAHLLQRDEPVEPAFLFVDAALRGPKSPSGQSAPSPWRIVQGLNSGCPLPMPCALGLGPGAWMPVPRADRSLPRRCAPLRSRLRIRFGARSEPRTAPEFGRIPARVSGHVRSTVPTLYRSRRRGKRSGTARSRGASRRSVRASEGASERVQGIRRGYSKGTA